MIPQDDFLVRASKAVLSCYKILEDSEQWRSSGLENRTVAAMWRQFDSVIFLQIMWH